MGKKRIEREAVLLYTNGDDGVEWQRQTMRPDHPFSQHFIDSSGGGGGGKKPSSYSFYIYIYRQYRVAFIGDAYQRESTMSIRYMEES